uniref:Uncharacterized protein n=1 Tax=Craspedostauros australis TaxID=1486917 RepID=A0A7R9ZP24_9STRA|mmetsp:Transcript_5222/g.14071  ORF Transcript_5222/g.14071 Transcript_5222/m.14071 type:complete len:470 (+) Transcript_5222:1234-2643(+)
MQYRTISYHATPYHILLLHVWQYITLDDIMDLVGTNDMQNEESTRKMWQESMKAVNCIQARITYDDFLLLMKGQERKAPRRKSFEQSTLAAALAMPLPNSEISSTGSLTPKPDPTLQDSTKGEVMQLHPLPNLQPQDETKAAVPSPIMSSPRRASSASPPGRKMIAEVLPVPEHEEAKGLDVTLTPTFPSRPAGADLGGRKRSLSLTDKDMDTRTISDDLMPKFGYDARRALAITEVAPGAPKSALAANKQLYRAHRQMRLAVLEASRRFEEKQVHRARDVLIAQKEAESAIQGAGLVMRHGTRAQVTSDAIRGYLQKTQQEQQQLVEKSSRRGGRGRSARKKTVSDMSEMMSGSLGQDELSLITAKIGSVTPKTDKSIFQQSTGNIGLPELTEGQVASAPPMPVLSSHVSIPEVKVVDRPDIRKATVPGNFQKTQDPFSSVGLYGAARLDTVAKITGELPSDSATPQE